MLETSNNGWFKCPPGELDRLTTRIRGKRRSRQWTNTVAAVFSSTVLTVLLSLCGIVVAHAHGYEPFTPHYPAVQPYNRTYCPAARNRPAPGSKTGSGSPNQ